MKYLDNQYITNSAKMPIKKGTLQFIQDSHKENLADFLRAVIGSTYNGAKFYVLYGCENSGSGSNYIISAGAVFFAGEVFRVDANTFTVGSGQVAKFTFNQTQYTTDADPVTFTDASTHNVHNIRKYTVAAGTSDGVTDYSLAVFGKFYDPFDVTDAWTLRSNVADVTVTGGSGTAVSTSNIKYKITGKTIHILFSGLITNTTAPTSFEILIPESKSYAGGINLTLIGGVVYDGSDFKHSAMQLLTGSPTKIKVILLNGDTLSNTVATSYSGQLTFEIA